MESKVYGKLLLLTLSGQSISDVISADRFCSILNQRSARVMSIVKVMRCMFIIHYVKDMEDLDSHDSHPQLVQKKCPHIPFHSVHNLSTMRWVNCIMNENL